MHLLWSPVPCANVVNINCNNVTLFFSTPGSYEMLLSVCVYAWIAFKLPVFLTVLLKLYAFRRAAGQRYVIRFCIE